MSHYVALAGLELPIWASQASNLKSTSCLCLFSAEIRGDFFPCLFKLANQDSSLKAHWCFIAFNSTCNVANAFHNPFYYLVPGCNSRNMLVRSVLPGREWARSPVWGNLPTEARVFEWQSENWTHAYRSLSSSCEHEMVVIRVLAADTQAGNSDFTATYSSTSCLCLEGYMKGDTWACGAQRPGF